MERNGPPVYRIRMKGRLGEDWADWFESMEMEVDTDSRNNPVTTLTGRVIDQPALQGLLARIAGLNLELISVQRVSEEE